MYKFYVNITSFPNQTKSFPLLYHSINISHKYALCGFVSRIDVILLYTYRIARKFNGEFNLTFFMLTVKLISVNVIFLILCAFLLGISSNLKSVIFLLCNLEAILSNFIPVKFSGHTVSMTQSMASLHVVPTHADMHLARLFIAKFLSSLF